MRRIKPPAMISGACGLAAAAALLLLIAGCGSATPEQGSAPTQAIAGAPPPVPQMVMVTFTDRGYRASDITVRMSSPVMLMLVDEGTARHSLRSSIPVVALQVEGVDAPVVSAADAAVDLIDVTVTAGQETDVTFTATQVGRYAIVVDGAPAGDLVVTA